MFRPLTRAVERKLTAVQNLAEVNRRIQDAFETYLHVNKLPKVELWYESAEETIIISAPNKACANELSMRLEEITQLLKEEKVRVKKIIIR